MNGFGLETGQPTQAILVPSRCRPLVEHAHFEGRILRQKVMGDALGMVM